jgi:hypothetical protein
VSDCMALLDHSKFSAITYSTRCLLLCKIFYFEINYVASDWIYHFIHLSFLQADYWWRCFYLYKTLQRLIFDRNIIFQLLSPFNSLIILQADYCQRCFYLCKALQVLIFDKKIIFSDFISYFIHLSFYEQIIDSVIFTFVKHFKDWYLTQILLFSFLWLLNSSFILWVISFLYIISAIKGWKN